MQYLDSYYNFESLLEKSIGSESIRLNYYSDIPKKVFYKLINTDPTSVRKKGFSKPGKYSKWLLIQYRKGNFGPKKEDGTDYLLNNEDYMKKLNYYLFIFSTGWFKSQVKNSDDYFILNDEKIDLKKSDMDIFKYKSLFRFTSEINKYVDRYKITTDGSKFDIVYSDDKIDILVPLNFTASFETAKNTDWCSQQFSGYSMWNQVAVLFRIIPKFTSYDKLKLTWGKKQGNYDAIWYLSGPRYPEVLGDGSPFDIVDGVERWEEKLEEKLVEYEEKFPSYKEEWVKKSKIISDTMSLVSKKAKKFIEDYYEKINKSKLLNEGIVGTLSKGKEILNKFSSPIQSKRNDDIANKYIKMIYDDYNKNKDLFRVNIRDNKGYQELEYMITNGDQNDVQLGNRDEDAITIEVSYRDNIFSGSDDTKARIEVTKFKSYLGDLVVLGREIRSGKIIDNINGEKSTNDKPISYVNISSGSVKKLINFFIKEFRRDYPTMTKYYGTRAIMELRPDLRDDVVKKNKSGREKIEKYYNDRRKKIVSNFSLLKMDPEDILDYFVEVEDVIKVRINYEQSIFIDNVIYDYTPNMGDKVSYSFIRVSEYDLDGNLNKNRNKFEEKDIPLERNVPYHKIMISLLEDYPRDDFKQRVDRVIKRIGFGLEVQSSILVENDGYDNDGGTPLNFMMMEADPKGGILSVWATKKANYLFYLKEK